METLEVKTDVLEKNECQHGIHLSDRIVKIAQHNSFKNPKGFAKKLTHLYKLEHSSSDDTILEAFRDFYQRPESLEDILKRAKTRLHQGLKNRYPIQDKRSSNFLFKIAEKAWNQPEVPTNEDIDRIFLAYQDEIYNALDPIYCQEEYETLIDELDLRLFQKDIEEIDLLKVYRQDRELFKNMLKEKSKANYQSYFNTLHVTHDLLDQYVLDGNIEEIFKILVFSHKKWNAQKVTHALQAFEYPDKKIRILLKYVDGYFKDLKAKEDEERRQKIAWKKSLIGILEVREILNASALEIKDWIDSGLIPIADYRDFYKWGRSLSTTLHEKSVIESLKEQTSVWRMEKQEILKEKRKLAVLKRKETDQPRKEKSDFLKTLHAKARFTKDNMVELRHRIEIPYIGLVEIKRHLNWMHRLEDADLQQQLEEQYQDMISRDQDIQNWKMPIDALIADYQEDEKKLFLQQIKFEIDKVLSRHSTSYRWTSQDLNVLDLQSSAELLNILNQCFVKTINQYVNSVRLDLKKKTGLSNYVQMFSEARSIKRKLYFNVGPTNSGKTYQAMEKLISSQSGCYLAPLRLMALEAFEKMSDLSLPVSMMTGEEHIVGDNANHVSSTIEMINLHKIVDVAIIDEIQMISDPDRGWAWTQAVIGVPAHHVIMTGSIDALSYVVKIAEMTGEELEVIHFERKNPLTVIPQSLSMQNIQEGDAIVAFSRAEVMRLREAFSEANKSVSVIYGALSPEARRAEARRFRNGESKILIATDAIAMGLNMPIHRVIFSALEKFDGKQVRPLYASEIRQIAGRAGRYGLAEKGEVGVLSGMLSNRIANALSAKPTEIKDNRLFVMPPWRAIEMVALALQTDNLCYILKHIAENLLNDDPMLIPASLETPLFIAEVLDATSLPLRTKHQYMGYPLEKKSDYSQADLKEWAGNHQNNKPNDYPICFQKSVPDTDLELAQCENTAKRLSAYQWLSLKWPDIYPNYKLASQERQRVNGLIESALKKKVISRACSDCGCAMPSWHRHKTCEECHDAKYRYRHYHNDDDDDDIY